MFAGVEVRELLGNETFTLDEMTVKTYHLTHTSYNIGYRFEYNGKAIAVTGDTSYDKDLIPLCKDADIVVMDVVVTGTNVNPNLKSTEKYADTLKARPHMLLNNAIKIATEAQPKTIIITHLPDDSFNPQAIRQAFVDGDYKGKVIFAEDGMELYP